MAGRHFSGSQASQDGYSPVSSPYGGTQQAAGTQQYGSSQQTGGANGQPQGSYVGPWVPEAENPYVSGPVSGAVGMGHEQVGPGRGGRRRKKRRRAPMLIVIILVLAALAGGGVWLYLNPPIYRITVNGTERAVKSGATLQDVIDEGFAAPVAGDLIAVDGSVAQEGAGHAFEADVDGTATSDPSYVVPRHATVTVEDGADVDEDYTETTEAIAHGESTGADIDSSSTYWEGSIHIYSAGEDGEQTVRTGAVSGKTVTEVTKEPVDAGYHVYTADVGEDKVVALTFDDGPWATTTAEILDILAENDAHATFFQIGNQISAMTEIENRIVAEGHQVATHSWDHASGTGQGVNLTFMSSDEQIQEIEMGFSAIEDTLGTSVTHIMRAPGGNYYGSIITTLKDYVVAEIGWDVDTEDWSRPGADAIAQAILSVEPGQVVLMHDGGGDRSQTVEALRTALPQLKAQGYSFITIDELLAYGMPE